MSEVQAPEPRGHIFRATVFDAAKAEEACRKLVDAYAVSSGDSVDNGLVSEAMGMAVEAFPGLQDFAFDLADRELDPACSQIDASGVSAGHDVSLLAAAAKLAVVGAAAEVNEGFEWSEADACVVSCREAIAGLPEAPATPGPR